MPLISYACLIIFLVTLLTGLRRDADFLSPARVFILLWSFVIGITDLKLSFLQSNWTYYNWFLVLLGLTTFILGIYISFIINLNNPVLTIDAIRLKNRNIKINENFLYKFIVIYFILYVIAYIIEWQVEGYIPLISAQPEMARKMYGIFGVHLIVQSINVILFLILEYFIFIRANKSKKFFLFFILIITTVTFALLLQRYNFIMLILMGISLFYYSGRKVNVRTFVIFAAIIISFVYGIQTLRESNLFLSYFYYLSDMKFSPRYAELTIPYMYISMNLETFVKYSSQLDHHSYGFFTLDFLTALAGVKHYILEYFNFEKFKSINGYNTYPFYWPYFYDFGIAGLAIIPFILGFIFSEFYYLLRKYPSLVTLSLYSVVFSVIAISYTSDPLTRLDMMYNFVIIVLVQIFIEKKSLLKINNYKVAD